MNYSVNVIGGGERKGGQGQVDAQQRPINQIWTLSSVCYLSRPTIGFHSAPPVFVSLIDRPLLRQSCARFPKCLNSIAFVSAVQISASILLLVLWRPLQ